MKRLSLLIVVTLIMGLIVAAPAFAAKPGGDGGGQDDSVLSQTIKEADGTTGQDTNSGSGVKTGHIQDGAVTDAKVTGPISASKVPHDHDTLYQKHLDNVIVVSTDGNGDFTSPVDALNAITDASATNPYLVKIMPGIYDIGASSIQDKAYVDIEGSGEKVTKITGSPVADSGVIEGCSSEIRFLTVESTSDSAALYNPGCKMTNVTAIGTGGLAISSTQSSMEFLNATVLAYGGTVDTYGIYCYICSITGSNAYIRASGATSYGVGGQDARLSGDRITIEAIGGDSYGIYSVKEINGVNIIVSGSNWTVGIYSGFDAQIDNTTIRVEDTTGSGFGIFSWYRMHLNNIDIAVNGGGYGVWSYNTAWTNDLDMRNMKIFVSGGSGYGVKADEEATLIIERSEISAPTNTVQGTTTGANHISYTRLVGGPVTGTNYTCTSVVDGSYDPVVCP